MHPGFRLVVAILHPAYLSTTRVVLFLVITQVFFCHLETGRAHRIALLHVHVLEALVDVSSRCYDSVSQSCSFHCSSQDLNFVTNFIQVVNLLHEELLFQLLHHVTHEPIIPWEKLVVPMHVLGKISRIHVQSVVDLTRLESKISCGLCHGVFPVSW